MTKTRSREVVIREAEFAQLLGQAAQPLASSAELILRSPELLSSAGTVHHLEQVARALETFVDDYGARQNKEFVTFGEIVASIRGLSAVKATALHLQSRLLRYSLITDPQPLQLALSEGSCRLDRSIRELLRGFQEEAKRHRFAPAPMIDLPNKEPSQRRRLPRNLDERDIACEEQRIAELAAMFLRVLERSRTLKLASPKASDELVAFVVDRATEKHCRWYESSVHSIQSSYDTFILGTAVERDHPWLSNFRGQISVALHLLEMATGLIHFYERHEIEARAQLAGEHIASMVEAQEVLELAVNLCLHYAYNFVEDTSDLADRILKTFVRQTEARLELPSGVSLHARPLALIVKVARHYGTPLALGLNGEFCSVSSLMSLLLLAGRHPAPSGVSIRGDARAVRDVEALFRAGLGEAGRQLPEELGYLQTKS
ncbi:MAG: hypothetical protein ACT4PU_03890 [Planctomycetota bacterium]